jgi:hypothetical protein
LDVASFTFNKELRRLAPIFADRAASLAESGGRALKQVWVAAESKAAWYHATEGRSAEALRRIDRALAEARTFLDAREITLLQARFQRASVLDLLGRYDDALAEVDAFAPIEAKVMGERHPSVLATRYLRATLLHNLGRDEGALAEIDAFAPIQAEVMGERHPGDPVPTRRRARPPRPRMATRSPRSTPSAPSRRKFWASATPVFWRTGTCVASCSTASAAMTTRSPRSKLWRPIHVEVLGERHPDVLKTRSLRARVLDHLGRHCRKPSPRSKPWRPSRSMC